MTEQPASLAAALADLQQHLPRIGKDAQAQYGKYADLADVNRALLPVLAERGFSWVCLPTMLDEGQFRLHYQLFWQGSGEEALIEGFYPLPVTGTPQQIGSAITYARRYCLLAVTGAAPDEDDDDAQAAESGVPVSGFERLRGWEEARAQRRMPPETRADGSATEAELMRMRSGSEPGAWRSTSTAENDTFYDQRPGEGNHFYGEGIPAGEPGEALAPEEDRPGSITKRQLSMMHAKFAALGIIDREKRLAWTEMVVGRPVGSANDLSYREAGALLEALANEARERSTT